jgi:hypothetical protein
LQSDQSASTWPPSTFDFVPSAAHLGPASAVSSEELLLLLMLLLLLLLLLLGGW